MDDNDGVGVKYDGLEIFPSFSDDVTSSSLSYLLLLLNFLLFLLFGGERD